MKKNLLNVLSVLAITFASITWVTAADADEMHDMMQATFLIDAVKTGDVGQIKRLLAEGTNPNYFSTAHGSVPRTVNLNPKRVGADGRTALMLATEIGNRQIAQLLIDAKANVNAKNREGVTALFLAAKEGRLEIADLLIANKAKTKMKTKSGWTPLMVSIRYGRDELTGLLKKAGASLKVKQLALSELFYGIKSSNISVVQESLNKGVTANVKDEQGFSALGVAAFLGDFQVIKLLLENGAKVNLAEPKHGNTALMFTAAKGNIDVMDALLAAGASVEKLNSYDVNAMDIALMNKQYDAAKYLIKKGADINAISGKQKETALHQAAYNDQSETVIFLLEQGADIEIKNKNLMQAFHHAMLHDNVEMVNAFVKHGVDVESQLENGITPFMMSVINGKFKTAKALLRHKANVDHPVAYAGDITLLMLLVAKGDHDLDKIKFLLQYGADPDLKVRGISALDKAIELSGKESEVVAMLAKYSKAK